MKNYKLKCQQCGEMFETSRKDAKYCSDSCRVMASRERKEENISKKTSVLTEYSKSEFNQLSNSAQSAGISIEDMVKNRSLIAVGDIEAKNREIDNLKSEIVKLKAHLSVYTKNPSSSGIFIPADEDSIGFIRSAVMELKPSINAQIRDDDSMSTSTLEEYMLYILRNSLNYFPMK